MPASTMPPSLQALLQHMEPVLNPGTYVFATVPRGTTLNHADVIASIREPEGLSVVVEESVAMRERHSPAFKCAWITLSVQSDLDAVGLTAAFSGALSRAGISCNVVAGAYHDHIFVPAELASAAMNELRALQSQARSQTVAPHDT